ncbi:MAG: hypothetical protein KDA87_25610, partial [Planctomycetales bacterium]|nr:hypothetical protein [Planctomycetales bacterium]
VGAGNVVSFEEDFESFALGPITVIQEPVVVGGTPFVVKSPGTDPGPTIVNDGDGGGRQPGFMQLSSEATGQQNFVTFDKTSDEYENIHATFDFRILDQNGNFADGMAFVLAPTSLYGDSGELNPGETAAEWSPAEEPHLAGALGVGFDTFNNDFGLDFEGCPTEGDTDLACEEPGNSDRRANHISLHWDGSVNADHVAQTVIPLGDLDLANSAWNKADVQISTSEDGMLVSMTVTDGSDGSVHSIFDNFLIEGADFGGPVRASFGARTGGSSDFHSIDNVNIIFGEGIPYDFDGDGQLAVGDLELLRQAVMGETNPLEFDVTADGAVNSEDILSLVSDADKLNTYIGDSNLDGEFSSSDFVVVFGAGQYEDGVPNNSTWVTGDWNGDGEFDSGDFVFAFTAGGYELGPRGGVQSVPEPSTWILALWALLPFVQRFRRS